jgi:hypothetical protein
MTYGTLVETADRMQIYKYVVHMSPTPTQDRRPSCPSLSPRTTARACTTTFDLERRQAALRRQRLCGPIETALVLHRRRHQARQGAERLHQSVDQQLQAPGARAFEAPVQLAYSSRKPLRLLPIPYGTGEKAERGRSSASPIRSPIPISLSRDHDGGLGRHPEPDPPRRADGQEPLRPAAAGAGNVPTVSARSARP